MKKTHSCAIAALTLAACLTLSSCEFFDRIFGKNPPPANDMQAVYTEKVNESETAAETTTAAAEETTAPDESGQQTSDEAQGGNAGQANYIEITVSEERYLYENHEISFDELTALLDGLSETTVVKLCDDNAAKKAYEALTKALDERGLMYEEKIIG